MNQFVKISSTGEQLPDDATDHVAVLDKSTNLMWQRDDSAVSYEHEDASKFAASLVIAGANDWRLPTRKELFGITDDTRHNPAIDTAFFNSHGDWVWTSTPAASGPDSAWAVYFYYGSVCITNRYYRCRVRAVRSAAPASQ